MNLVYCIVGVGPCPEVFDPESCWDGDIIAKVDGSWVCGDATEIGVEGPAGPPGEQGYMGPQGEVGEQGPQGPGGVPGPAGDPGAAGSQGPAGVGVASVQVNGDGALVVTFTDGSSTTSAAFADILATIASLSSVLVATDLDEGDLTVDHVAANTAALNGDLAVMGNASISGMLGLGTPSPGAYLDMRGGVAGDDRMQRWGAGGSADGFTTLELFKVDDAYGDWLLRTYWAGSGNSGKIGFGRYASTPWDGAQMVLDTQQGHLGVGTADPGARLHVQPNGTGTIAKFSRGGGAQWLTIATEHGWLGTSIEADGAGGVHKSFDLVNRTDGDIRAIMDGGGDFSVARNIPPEDLLVVKNSGNVGIGITSPSEKLQVAGTVKADSFVGTLAAAAGSAIGTLTLANGSITDSSGAISFGNEGLVTTGTLASGDLTVEGQFSVGSGGNSAIHADASGNLLFNDPSGAAHSIFDGSGGVCVGSDCSQLTAPKADIEIFDSTPTLLFSDGSGGAADFEIGADGNTLFARVEGGANALAVDASGNVGVGTPNPTSRLQVVGGDFVVDNADYVSQIGHPNGNSYIGGHQIHLRGGSAEGYATAMMVDTPSGRVGIGASSPDMNLHVKQAGAGDAGLKIETTSAGDPTIMLASQSNREGVIKFTEDGATSGQLSYAHNGDVFKFVAGSATTVRAQIGETTSYFTSKLGVGTDDPQGLLHVRTAGSSFSATGGTVTYSDGDTIHTFYGSGTFTPNGVGTVEVLVIGGGGSGAGSGGTNSSMGGGGGAGGFVEKAAHAVTAQGYAVTVGAGGPAGQPNNNRDGEDSSFDNIIAKGGGGGVDSYCGHNGGSGGGSGWGCPQQGAGGGVSTQGDSGGGTGYGNNGGGGGVSGCPANGGGGGAGEPGQTATCSASGSGGSGRASEISGAWVIYAAGGGGGASNWGPGAGGGGLGGGGQGGTIASPQGHAGAPNTGSGGGGAANNNPPSGASAGGSGIVIIRYPTPSGGKGLFVDASSGNVGIGMTNPSVALDVAGSIEYSGDLTSVSDARLKENIAPFTGGLDKVLGIEAKYYNMLGTPDEVEIGFIAQNVQAYAPEAVSVIDPEHHYLGVSYTALIPVAFHAIRELNDWVSFGFEAQLALHLEQMGLQEEVNAELRGTDRRLEAMIGTLQAAQIRQQRLIDELRAESEALRARLRAVESRTR